jgi:hypothetical protein
VSVRKLSTASILSPSYKNSKLWDGETFPGYFESIQTVVVPSGGTSSVSFTNIPQNYAHLQVRILSRTNRSDQNGDFFQTTFNGDTNANYSWHFINGNGSSANAISGTSQTMMEANRVPGSLIGANMFGSIIIDILDYTNTNKNTTIRSLGGWDGNGSGEVYFNSGSWRNTAAVTSITFTNSGSRTIQQYSNFALYGIRSA